MQPRPAVSPCVRLSLDRAPRGRVPATPQGPHQLRLGVRGAQHSWTPSFLVDIIQIVTCSVGDVATKRGRHVASCWNVLTSLERRFIQRVSAGLSVRCMLSDSVCGEVLR